MMDLDFNDAPPQLTTEQRAELFEKFPELLREMTGWDEDERDEEATPEVDSVAFLRLILPAEGVYIAMWAPILLRESRIAKEMKLDEDRWTREPCSTIEELAAGIRRNNVYGRQVFHACASYVTPSNRKQNNVHLVQSLWGEVEAGPGKPYADWSVAIEALFKFCDAAGLPTPMCVRSGFGIHFYWPLTKPLDPKTWKRYARALKAACKKHGLQIDPKRMADEASILRTPGSTNRKGEFIEGGQPESPVIGLSLVERYDLALFDGLLHEFGNGADTEENGSNPFSDFADQTSQEEWTPVKAARIRSALEVLDSDSYESWWNRGAELHSTGWGELAYAIWLEWSCTSKKYDRNVQLKTWRDYGRPYEGEKRTLASLFYEARAAGWTDARAAPPPAEPKPADDKSSDPPGWPKLDDAAYHGIVGEIVRKIEPTTEADPVAILLQLLTCFGNAVGRQPYYRVEADKHYPNLFCLLVGASSKGRKGTSRQRVVEIMAIADLEWECKRVESGLSSGEGLIYAVRDKREGRNKEGQDVVFDEGVADKRLMIFEGEFASTLAVMKRDGNTLSPLIRNSWDGIRLSTLTRTDPLRSTEALVSIVAHITADELRRELDRISMGNGFANRFLIACIKRSKLLPQGGGLGAHEVKHLGEVLKDRLEQARKWFRVEMTDDCKALWARMYAELSEESPGLLGSIVARAEAQTIRLALIYALINDRSAIGVEHLEAARAVWNYCDASARYIFGDMIGDPVMDEILRALRHAGEAGMSRTQISDLFGRNKRSDQLGAALEGLRIRGKAHSKVAQVPPATRPVEFWYANAPR